MSNRKGILCKSMLIGSMVGGLLSLLHRETREGVKETAGRASTRTRAFARTLREDPAQVKRQVQETSENIKTLVNDVRSETQDVLDTFKDIRSHSEETYRSIKETGGELRELGDRLKDPNEERRED